MTAQSLSAGPRMSMPLGVIYCINGRCREDAKQKKPFETTGFAAIDPPR
jgi:hypothetical protein